MFNSIRKLFSRRAESAVETAGNFEPGLSVPSAVPRPDPSRIVRVQPQPRAGAPAGPAPSNFALPLKSVINRLPVELMQRVGQLDVGEAELFLPMQKVLAQIATGSVRISFGELRQLAPPGTFTAENDRDRTLVELPLNEILARLNPAFLPRRAAQRQVEVPADIAGPFGGQNRVMISSEKVKPGAPVQPAARPPAPVAPAPVLATPIPIRPPIQPPARPQATPQAAPQPPAAPFQPAPRAVPVLPPAQPTPRPQAPATPFAPGQPVFARIREASANPAAAPVSPLNPAPVFERQAARPPALVPQPFTPPAYSPPPSPPAPIAPARVPVPVPMAKGDTDVISMSDRFGGFAPAAAVAAPPAPAAPVATRPPVRAFAIPAAPVAPFTPFAPVPVAPLAAPAAPIPVPAPAAPLAPFAPNPVPEPAPARYSAPQPAEPVMPEIVGETRFITVSMAELSLSWPEAVRQDLHAQHLSNSFVGLPLGAVEGAIRHGKIAFPWKAIRSWIKPPIPAAPSTFDTAMLELPLKVVTPLFIAELKANRPQRKVAVDATIPNLFYGAGASAAAPVPSAAPAAPAAPTFVAAPAAPVAPPPLPVGLPTRPAAAAPPARMVAAPQSVAPAPVAPPPSHAAPAGKPADTNYYVWKDDDDSPDETAIFIKKGESPGTAFLNRYATPNEIVNKAASLGGVDGALIALPDGLLVASRIPASMNADTIAAFLPQIFGRVTQCTKELRLGELNNLNFTVGNTPWKIFRVGSIYFAVFGRSGEPLPTSQLVGLAAELDRKAK